MRKWGDGEGGREGINPKEGRIGYGDGNKKHSNVRIVIVSSKSSTFYTGARDTISVSAQIFLGVPVVKSSFMGVTCYLLELLMQLMLLY